MALGIDADGNIYLSVFGYGSCEICDPTMNCETKDEVTETFESIKRGVVKASTFKEMSKVIENKIMSDHILTEDWIGFLSKINDKFQGELHVVLHDLDPEDTISHLYEENVETLDDFMRITIMLCKIFPRFDFLEMDIYLQWLHAYLVVTGADELSEEIVESHKGQFASDSFELYFEEFRDAMLAVKLAKVLNECPDAVLAISSLDLTEYILYHDEAKVISDELLAYVQSLLYKKLNLGKFNDAHYFLRKNHKPKFHFTKTDDFDKLERLETSFSIRRNKFLEFSSLEIESLEDNEDILFVRKQKRKRLY